mgnify:FL=1
MNINKIITIIIPDYNEEMVIEECYRRIRLNLEKIKNYNYEMIFINDGSKDKTLELLEEIAKNDKNVKVISFSRNFGHQAAVEAGLKEISGDVVLIIDADLQDPPELIHDMLNLWEKGNDIVYGKRTKRDGENIFKLFSAKMFYKTLNKISDVYIPLNVGDFRLVDRKVIDVINQLPEHNKFFRGLFSWVGYKQVPYEYERKERFAGKTKYSLKQMLKLALDGIIGFSVKPLRIIGAIGICSIVISFLLFIYTILLCVYKLKTISIETMIILIAITFFFGIQMVAIWIVSEYIGRIYDEAKQRPSYIIKQKINF